MKRTVFFCMLACLAAFSEDPDVSIHYRYDGPRSERSEIMVERNRLYKISTESDPNALVCRSAELNRKEIRFLLLKEGYFRLTPGRDHPDYECDGYRSLFLRIGGKSTRLYETCKPQKDGMDSAIDHAMDSLANYLSGLVERDEGICPDGFYLRLAEPRGPGKLCGDINRTAADASGDADPLGLLSLAARTPWFPVYLGRNRADAAALDAKTLWLHNDCYEIEIMRQSREGFGILRD
jgi:hypothetical protein